MIPEKKERYEEKGRMYVWTLMREKKIPSYKKNTEELFFLLKKEWKEREEARKRK